MSTQPEHANPAERAARAIEPPIWKACRSPDKPPAHTVLIRFDQATHTIANHAIGFQTVAFQRFVINGNGVTVFPVGDLRVGATMENADNYLKKHTEALVKDVGIEAACELSGKSKATLGRYYSDAEEHASRFMPIDTVAQLEAASGYPHVTAALSELRGITMSYDGDRRNTRSGGVNADVIALSQRFALLMAEYNQSIEDGVISVNEAKRLLRETVALQQVLLEMKLHLEEEQT